MIDCKLLKKIYAYLEEQFKDDTFRLKHTLNVKEVALKLGEIYSVDQDKITVAALLHDSTKNLSFEENLDLISNMFIEDQVKLEPKSCLHAYSAAALARSYFGITDNDIINAIAYHCSGRMEMSDLEKIIFVSDYIEESRDFVDEETRVLAKTNLVKAVYKIMIETKEHLLKEQRQISPITQAAILYYKKEMEELND